MKLNRHLRVGQQIISQKFPHLSLPQINGLATWSFGMVITRSSSLSKVSTIIAKINQEKENTVRQRLKEWYKEGTAKAKNGNKRVSLDVKECFPFLERVDSRFISTNNSRVTNSSRCNEYRSTLYSSFN